jgi:parallel beta-helix repeat protein
MKKKITVIFYSALFMLALSSVCTAESIRITPQQGFGAIQRAVNDARSGDAIIISQGSYRSAEPLKIENKENIRLIGTGVVNLISTSEMNNVVEIRNSSSVVFDNLRATHVPAAEGCAGSVLTISNSKHINVMKSNLNGCGVIGISLSGCKDVTITENILHNNSYAGIMASNCENIVISKNRIINNKHTGVIFYSSKKVTLTSNVFSNNKVKNITSNNTTFAKRERNTPSDVNALESSGNNNSGSNSGSGSSNNNGENSTNNAWGRNQGGNSNRGDSWN